MCQTGVRKQYLSTRHCICLLSVLLDHMLNTRVWLWLPTLLINVVTFTICLPCKTVIWKFHFSRKIYKMCIHLLTGLCHHKIRSNYEISKSRLRSIPCRPSFTIKSTRLDSKFLSPKASAQISFTAKATPYPATSWSLHGSKEKCQI